MRQLHPSHPSPTPSVPTLSAALTEMVRRCQATECFGLEVPAPGVPVIAAAALEEAANNSGGLVWRPRRGGFWLLGATPGAAQRARTLVEGMGWLATPLSFPQDLARLQAALDAEGTSASQPAVATRLADMEDRAARLDRDAGHGLTTLWRMEGTAPRLLGQRWTSEPEALLNAPVEQDWRGHAQALLGARLLARARAAQWPAQRKPTLPLLLDMPWMPPPDTLPAPPDNRPGHVLVLPLAAAADASAWLTLATAAGWDLAWSGLTAGLSWLATPDRLPGAWFFARFSPALASDAWPAPERLALCPTNDRAALTFALGRGAAMCSRMDA